MIPPPFLNRPKIEDQTFIYSFFLPFTPPHSGSDYLANYTAYNGIFSAELQKWGRFANAILFEKASRPPYTRGLVPVAKPHRRIGWIVERTIAWTNFFRRQVKDYEYTVSSSVGWLYLGNIQSHRRPGDVTVNEAD